jgi:Putative metallopeptidase
LSKTTQDALLHVLAHEIGHAMLREFDLPVLGPEEDIADDFATVYIHMMLPDRAGEIVAARARQNLADAETAGMFSEYRSDDQRAGRMVCLLYGLDPERHADLAQTFGLAGDEAALCRDMASEVGRSWRRIIDTYRMPDTARVTEVGSDFADTPIAKAVAESDLMEPAYQLLAGIDWHSLITVAVEPCDGTSFWSRNGRRITLCEAYVARFEDQLGD